MSYIQVRNLWQTYGDQVVLENLRIDIEEGEFCALVGASGCGKSTFLRMLLGQEAPSRGKILLDGKPLATEPDASRGIVFQRYSVLPHLSVLDNVALGLELPRAPFLGRLFGRAKVEAREQAATLLKRVGLGHSLDKTFDTIPFTALFNITGQPAMSVPLCWNSAGLPIGVQLAGRFGEDALLLRLAGQLEQARPWFHRVPVLA